MCMAEQVVGWYDRLPESVSVEELRAARHRRGAAGPPMDKGHCGQNWTQWCVRTLPCGLLCISTYILFSNKFILNTYIHYLYAYNLKMHPYSNCKEYAFIGRGVRALRDLTDTYSDEVERTRARKFRYRYFADVVIYTYMYMHTYINAYVIIAPLLEIWKHTWKLLLCRWKSWRGSCLLVG